MAEYICSICGYTHEGNNAPGRCPVCKSPSSQFKLSEVTDKKKVEGIEHTAKTAEYSPIGENVSPEKEYDKGLNASNYVDDANRDEIAVTVNNDVNEEENKKKFKENIKTSFIGSIIVFIILLFTGFTSIIGIIIEIIWVLAVIGMLTKDENGKYV